MKATFSCDLLCPACGRVMDIERYEHRRFCVVCRTQGCFDFNRKYALPQVELVELSKTSVATKRDVLLPVVPKKEKEE